MSRRLLKGHCFIWQISVATSCRLIYRIKSSDRSVELRNKVKVHSRTDHEIPEVCGQRHAPAALPLGKTRDPLYKRLGGPQGRSGQVRRILSQPGFDLRAVKPEAGRYAYWDFPAHCDAEKQREVTNDSRHIK